jgi:predicted dehydrogenase
MTKPSLSRRNFVGAGISAFTIIRPELVRGSGKERLKAGLVGCGGRGTQAAWDLLSGAENVELAAMADLFEDHLEGSLAQLRDPKGKFAGVQDKIKVDPEHHFTGFDAYKKVIASDVDIVMLCTPPGYRPMHFEAAVEARKHVFAEKPIATDPVGARRFIAAAKKSEQLKLTVMSGAHRRSFDEFMDTIDKIHNGKIGELTAAYSWYLSKPVFHVPARDAKWADTEFQHRNWYSYLWLCGDQVVEQHFHNLDTINWVMCAHPVKVVASGGAAWRPREEYYGNIYDHMCADFEYANGVHFSSQCRQYPGSCAQKTDDLVVGTKGHSNCRDMSPAGMTTVWAREAYVAEHVAMVRSIRGEGPYINHGMNVAESTLTGIMARESAYSGQAITWDQIMNSKQDLMPKAFDLREKMGIPPLPVPGIYKFV